MTLPRILVVDDEPGMLRSVERVLGQNYHVAGTRVPTEAVELVDTFGPDLAILDVRMPGMDGFELMGRLKASRPNLDIILMTGSVHELDAHLIRAIRQKAFYFLQKPFDRELLQTLVERCLEMRRLGKENTRHLRRLEEQLAEARAFQQSMLPQEQACLGGAAVSARYLPCYELGGDFFDYASGGRDTSTLLVADVSGHGATAAMLTGIVKSAFHSASPEGYEPRSVVERVSAGIRTFGHERFVTLICARLSVSNLVLEYVNAGHPPGILWGKHPALTFLEATGPLISPAFPSFSWVQKTLRLEEDHHLLLYTDGVEEVGGETGFFGLERIVEGVAKNPDGGITLLDEILRSVREFSGGRRLQDDLTLITANAR
jgi:sigma-B regulation protein RsbU (phosphoserine phosphatase)